MKEKLDWVKLVINRTNIAIQEYNRRAEARIAELAQLEKKLTRILEEDKANIEMIREILRKRFSTL